MLIKTFILSAILSAQNYLKNIGIVLNSTTSTLICMAFISCYSYLFYKKQLFLDNTKTILFAFLIYITAEYFLSAHGVHTLLFSGSAGIFFCLSMPGGKEYF
jgi:hypothetical protein